MPIDLTGIQNVGEFYSHHYLDALLEKDLRGLFRQWRSAEGDDTPDRRLNRCATGFFRAKRDAMLAALDRHLGDFEPPATSWTRPAGGLYVYLTLPEWVDTSAEGDLFAAALAEGVVYVPGAYCYGPDPRREIPTHHIRLTFATVDEAAISEGIRRLARALRKVSSGPARGPAPLARPGVETP